MYNINMNKYMNLIICTYLINFLGICAYQSALVVIFLFNNKFTHNKNCKFISLSWFLSIYYYLLNLRNSYKIALILFNVNDRN